MYIYIYINTRTRTHAHAAPPEAQGFFKMPIWDYNDKLYLTNDIKIKELPGEHTFQKDVPYIRDITFRKHGPEEDHDHVLSGPRRAAGNITNNIKYVCIYIYIYIHIYIYICICTHTYLLQHVILCYITLYHIILYYMVL